VTLKVSLRQSEGRPIWRDNCEIFQRQSGAQGKELSEQFEVEKDPSGEHFDQKSLNEEFVCDHLTEN
jgi:hypothetical protein